MPMKKIKNTEDALLLAGSGNFWQEKLCRHAILRNMWQNRRPPLF
jgi:hypothetical protein